MLEVSTFAFAGAAFSGAAAAGFLSSAGAGLASSAGFSSVFAGAAAPSKRAL
jgi:hypothetical protein